ncbi:hypothetical protein BC835DRAFT_433075 [Cytidiella melzeri]|nr:hypothetical protein BC835DRAFT_433075 [Cytidiella melzeri]
MHLLNNKRYASAVDSPRVVAIASAEEAPYASSIDDWVMLGEVSSTKHDSPSLPSAAFSPPETPSTLSSSSSSLSLRKRVFDPLGFSTLPLPTSFSADGLLDAGMRFFENTTGLSTTNAAPGFYQALCMFIVASLLESAAAPLAPPPSPSCPPNDLPDSFPDTLEAALQSALDTTLKSSQDGLQVALPDRLSDDTQQDLDGDAHVPSHDDFWDGVVAENVRAWILACEMSKVPEDDSGLETPGVNSRYLVTEQSSTLSRHSGCTSRLSISASSTGSSSLSESPYPYQRLYSDTEADEDGLIFPLLDA